MPFKSKFFRSQLNGLKRWQGHGILLERECIWGKCAIFLKTNCHPFFRPLNFKLKMIGALLHCLCFLLLVNRDLGAPQFDTRSKCFSSLCRRGLFDKNFSYFSTIHFPLKPITTSLFHFQPACEWSGQCQRILLEFWSKQLLHSCLRPKIYDPAVGIIHILMFFTLFYTKMIWVTIVGSFHLHITKNQPSTPRTHHSWSLNHDPAVRIIRILMFSSLINISDLGHNTATSHPQLA